MSAEKNYKPEMTMSVSGKTACSKEAVFHVEAAEVDKASAQIIREISRQVQVEGFRKGKVPAAVVKARFGKYVTEELEKSLQSAAVEMAQKDNDIVSVTAVDTKGTTPECGKSYDFTIAFDVAPVIKLPDYKKIAVTIPKSGDPAKEEQERLDYLKNLYSEYATVTVPAVMGDMLKVSYTSDFAAPEDASASLKRMAAADDAWLWLNDAEYVPGANKALTGAATGDTREFKSVFPADWRESGLAGKTVTYKMTVKEVQHKEMIQDEKVLAEKLHLDTVEKLHEEIKKQIASKIEHEKKEATSEKIMEALVAGAGDFELPKSVIDQESEHELQKLANKTIRSEEDLEKFKAEKDKHLEEARKEAEKNMRKFFIIRQIAKTEKIEIDPAELDAQITAMSAYYGYKEKDLRATMSRNGGMMELQAGMLTGKVTDFIAKTATVTEA